MSSRNKIVMMCAAINDVTSWPFWKYLQMKKVKGVTDLVMLAFNSEGGSFIGRIHGSDYSVRNYENVKGYHQPMLEEFLEKEHSEGRTYFVYGGHGMGDYLELEEHKQALQVHQLAAVMGKKQYEACLFDACFMSNLDCAYHLRKNTRWVGACEGYMWEEDVALDNHIFNTFTASAMSRFKDPKHNLEIIQRDFCNKSLRGDFAVLDTTHSEALLQFVEKHVMQSVYDQATFIDAQQHEALQQAAEDALLCATDDKGDDAATTASSLLSGGNASLSAFLSPAGRSKKRRLNRAVQFRHALYPSELEDKHLVDLKSYLEELPDTPPSPPALEHSDSPVASSSSSASSSSTSTERSLREQGLQLFHSVVVSHIAPQQPQVYAATLGGLSLAVHEFSHLSSPLPLDHPHDPHHKKRLLDKTILQQKANEFLTAARPTNTATRTHQQPQPPQRKKREKDDEVETVTVAADATTPPPSS